MNLRTTLLLIVLLAAGGAAYHYHDALAQRLGYAPQHSEFRSPALTILEQGLRPGSLRRIEVAVGGEPVVLERSGKSWNLPGGWPTRTAEAHELADLIAGLGSRFEPIPVQDAADLHPYGLDPDQKPVRVTVTIESGGPEKLLTYALTFGEPPQTEGNPFTRPTYVRVEGYPEVIRAAPGLLTVLQRPRDAYRKRQLFPEVERVKLADPRPNFPGEPDTPPPAAVLLDAKALTVTGPDGTWTLKRTVPQATTAPKPGADLTTERLAERWELAAPVTDKVDPERLRNILTAVPELWVEGFVNDADAAKTGLDKPERKLHAEFYDRAPVTLLIGNVSRVSEKKPPAPPPASPFAPPPPPPAVREEFRYAKLPDNPQVFEIKSDRLGDLFVAPTSLRDTKLLRFRPADVRRVEIVRPDATIVLAKERDESAKEDRWKLLQPVAADAESTKVTELIDRASELQAAGPDLIDKADPKAYDLDPNIARAKLVLEVVEESPAAGEVKPQAKRTLTLHIGRHDTDKNKLYVKTDTNPRIAVLGDDFLKLFERPALVYRGRKLLDVPTKQIAAITVQRGGEQLRLEQADGAWKLAGPDATPADATKAGQLAGDLSRLEVVEYVSDAPKPEDLAKYGLDNPALTATLTFTNGQPTKMLEVGKPREGKPEVYAKLAGAPVVFTLRDAVRNTLDQPSLAYRPLQLWHLSAGAVMTIEVQRGGETYRVAREGGEWKVHGPFDAPASPQSVQPLVDQLASPRAERYETQKADNLAKFGLDKPELRLTVTAEGESAPKTLLVGKPAGADTKSRFAKLADSDAVAVVPEALALAADRPALDLLSRQLLSLNANLITQVRGTGPDGTWELKREGGAWKITSLSPPIAADHQAADTLLKTWADLRATRYAAYGPKADLAKFGLDKPAATVTVTLVPDEGKSPATHTLALGHKEPNTEAYFARLDNGPGVVVLPPLVARGLTHTAMDFADRTLLAFDPSELTAIRRKAGTAVLELAKKDDGWQIIKPTAHKADQPGLEELAERLGGLRAARIAALDAKDLRPFGLDRPAATVALMLQGKDGKVNEKALRIGGAAPPAEKNVTPPPEERFAQVEGTNTVAVLPAAVSKRLTAEPLKFRDRSVARFADADRVFVERGPRRVIFAKLEGTWKMTEPVAAEAEATELDELVNAIARLRADELVAENATDLRPYGLDRPEARWRFLAGDREVLQLLVGKRDEATGRCYAKLTNGNLVFFLDPGLSNRLLSEYRKRALWAGFDAAQAETLVYNVGGATLVLQKADNAWQVPGKPDQPVNAAAVNDVLTTLANLKVERYAVDKGADLKAFGLQPPVRTVVARTRTGTTATLYLGKNEGNSKRVYGRVLDHNRTDVFVLSEADSAKLVKELKDFTK